jgi:tetrahydromethanopterin S-methyltransferase subunit B
MLPLVKIVPEYSLTLDPSTGKIGAALGREVLVLSMDDINKEITALEVAADDLISSLDPNTTSDMARPGREGAYVVQGTLTNMAYGFLIALVLFILALPLIQTLGVL